MANPGDPYARMSGLLNQAYDLQGRNVGGIPMQALAGASQAIAPMMGPQRSPVGIGQLLAAAGGGAMQGQMQGLQSQISLADVQAKMQQAQTARDTATQQSTAIKALAKMLYDKGDTQGAAAVLAGKTPADFMQKFEKVGRGERLINPVTGEVIGGGVSDNTMDPNQVMTQEGKLNSEFAKVASTELEQVDGYRRFEAIFTDPSSAGPMKIKVEGKAFTPSGGGASDIALIFSFMKMLDPRSVVREGEFDQAQSTGGASDKFISLVNQVANGQRLTEAQRRDLATQARAQYNSAAQSLKTKADNARNTAGQYQSFGIDPARVAQYTQYNPMLNPNDFVSSQTNANHRQGVRPVPNDLVPVPR